MSNAGTIPDRGLFGVFLAGGQTDRSGRHSRRVGELDEEMVYESRVGDVFVLGATSWRIEDITADQVLVSPAAGQPAARVKMPGGMDVGVNPARMYTLPGGLKVPLVEKGTKVVKEVCDR